MIGRKILHYEIVDEIGGDFTGKIYKAKDTSFDRCVSIRTINIQDINVTRISRDFEKDARHLTRLSHPNIATVYDFDEFGDKRLIVFEYLQGKNLKELITEKKKCRDKFEIPEILDFAIQIADALTYAHRHKIYHGNLNLNKIVVTGNNRLKIFDFLVAKYDDSNNISANKDTDRTPSQTKVEKHYIEFGNRRGDIIATGKILYSLLSTKSEVDEEELSEALLADAIKNRKKPASFDDSVPMPLVDIIFKCITQDKRKRFQKIKDLYNDLVLLKGELNGRKKVAPLKLYSKRFALSGIIAFIIIAIALIIFMMSTSASNKTLVVVFPFKNLNAAGSYDYFGNGVADDIVGYLTKIEDLRVISRTRSHRPLIDNAPDLAIDFPYKINAILTGDIRLYDNVAHINIFLNSPITGELIWSKNYRGLSSRIFKTLSQMSSDVASILHVKVSAEVDELLAKQSDTDILAYQYYLEGRSHYYRYTQDDMQKALERFKKSLEIDPKFARSYAGMGDAYAQLVIFMQYSLEEYLLKGEEACNKAIELNPELPYGYKALGLVHFLNGYHKKAVADNLKAIELNPSWCLPYGNLSEIYSILGQLDLGLKYAAKGAFLDPSFPFSFYLIGEIYTELSEFDKAEYWFKRTLQVQKDYSGAHVGIRILPVLRLFRSNKFKEAVKKADKILNKSDINEVQFLAFLNLFAGDLPEAEKSYSTVLDKLKGNEIRRLNLINAEINLSYIYLMSDRESKAWDLLDKNEKDLYDLLEKGNDNPMILFDIAVINALRGDKAEAYKWLEKAIDAGFIDYHFLINMPLLKLFAKDEAFILIVDELQNKMNRLKESIGKIEKEDLETLISVNPGSN